MVTHTDQEHRLVRFLQQIDHASWVVFDIDRCPVSQQVQFSLFNEFEQPFSASTTITCWADTLLTDIDNVFDTGSLGSDIVQTRMRPSTGTASGFMVVATETHRSGNGDDEAGSASVNVHSEGEGPAPDLIVIPADQLLP